VRGALEVLLDGHDGQAWMFDGIHLSTTKLRARALCGRRPAQLVLAGSIDAGSSKLFEDASIGIFGVPGDRSDDIFTIGLALDAEAFEEIARLIPEGFGEALGAETNFLRRTLLSEAGQTLRGLVP
jgi:hypothetical protein